MTDDATQKRSTATSFGAAAAAYRESDTHRSGADLARLASWVAGATRALDVATGAGHTAGAVSETATRVVAADAAPEMVATTEREYPDVEGVVADAERLPFVDSCFDAVTCRIAAHHFPDPAAFVAEVARVLEPGGTFALEDTVAPDDLDLGAFVNRVESLRDPTHVESYTVDRWHGWLADAGLTLEETVVLKTPLDFETWVDAQSLSPADRDRVETTLLEASDAAVEAFAIERDGDSVRSFANHKVLVRARR